MNTCEICGKPLTEIETAESIEMNSFRGYSFLCRLCFCRLTHTPRGKAYQPDPFIEELKREIAVDDGEI